MVDFLSSTALRILGTRDDIAALAAIDTTILKTGAGVYVSSVSGLYLLDKSSTAAADGTAVVAPVNGRGRWFLQDLGFNVLTQQVWGIAPLTGDDSGPGTLAQPLKTGAEFTRRVFGKGLPFLVEVTLLEEWPDPMVDYIGIDNHALNDDAGMVIRGVNPAVPAATGAFTVVNNAVADTSLTTVQTDIDLSGFVDYRLRILSSASAPVGTTMWIEAEAAGVATLSAPTFVDTSNPAASFWSPSFPTLTVGDTFVVEKPITGPQLWGGIDGMGSFVSGSLFNTLFRIDNLLLGSQLVVGTPGIDGYIVKSKLEGTYKEFTAPTGFILLGCRINGGIIEGKPFMSGCSIANLPGGVATAFTTDKPSSLVFFNTRNSARGIRYHLTSGFMRIGNGGGNANGGLSVHQWSGTGGGVRIGELSRGDFNGIVWGASTNANTYGLQVDALGGIAYDPTTKPTITGATADTRIGTTNTAYGAIPVFNTTFGAGIVEHQD